MAVAWLKKVDWSVAVCCLPRYAFVEYYSRAKFSIYFSFVLLIVRSHLSGNFISYRQVGVFDWKFKLGKLGSISDGEVFRGKLGKSRIPRSRDNLIPVFTGVVVGGKSFDGNCWGQGSFVPSLAFN